MLAYTDHKKGVLFTRDGKPYEVVESSFSRMQQRKAVVQARIRDLTTGKLADLTLQPSDYFEEADVQKRPLMFLYEHRGDFVFTAADVSRSFDAKAQPVPERQNLLPQRKATSGAGRQRFTLKEDAVGDAKKWLKPNTEVTAVFFNDALLTFMLPIKMDFKVTDAPPGIQGDRAQGGAKAVTLETGAVVQAPLFINTGDIIRINTETGTYVERMEKS